MKEFDELLAVISRLRDKDNGCPWDLKQTSETLLTGMVEEVYEVVEAVENHDIEGKKEELGDLLLHVFMQSQIAKEMDEFSAIDVVNGIKNKLIRRHPHVFGDDKISDPDLVKKRWEQIKKKEKKDRKSVLDGIPKGMPALLQAQRIQEKAASVGFDWDSLAPVFEKINEEIGEVKEELVDDNQNRIEEEVGDLLFAVVNLARKLDIDSEKAMKKANDKFSTRFKKIEQVLEKKGENINDKTLRELDQIWEIIKETE